MCNNGDGQLLRNTTHKSVRTMLPHRRIWQQGNPRYAAQVQDSPSSNSNKLFWKLSISLVCACQADPFLPGVRQMDEWARVSRQHPTAFTQVQHACAFSGVCKWEHTDRLTTETL